MSNNNTDWEQVVFWLCLTAIIITGMIVGTL